MHGCRALSSQTGLIQMISDLESSLSHGLSRGFPRRGGIGNLSYKTRVRPYPGVSFSAIPADVLALVFAVGESAVSP